MLKGPSDRTGVANRYRKDLQEAGLGAGCHSFVFKPPAGLTFALDAVEVLKGGGEGRTSRPGQHMHAPGVDQ